MLITVSNALTVTNPTPEMLMWCKRNLVISNPEYAKKARMNLWLGNTPKTLFLYETRGNELVLPFGTLRSLPKEITDKAIFISEFAPPVEIDFQADVPLYDYQEDAVQAMIAAKYGILQSAAGSGKTQMGIALAARLGRRTLWLCHTLDLIKQSKERAERYMSKDLMGTITEGKVNLGNGITFATIQTMCKLDLPQYKDYWDCIITDEVHTLYRVRKTWADSKSQLGAYKVLANAKKKADENPGYSVFDENGKVVYSGKSTTTTTTFTPYLVRVTADVLNIRKGAGTNYGTNGAIRDKGVYTIVAEASGQGATKWGKLKSGAGWISLDYTKKV